MNPSRWVYRDQEQTTHAASDTEVVRASYGRETVAVPLTECGILSTTMTRIWSRVTCVDCQAELDKEES